MATIQSPSYLHVLIWLTN
uniref:Uncharacterized protein n=1 Tax=Arundo donax TaxID=35708 RepID=A0A0A9FI96_ARUDO